MAVVFFVKNQITPKVVVVIRKYGKMLKKGDKKPKNTIL
jgi:hypothetical protein